MRINDLINALRCATDWDEFTDFSSPIELSKAARAFKVVSGDESSSVLLTRTSGDAKGMTDLVVGAREDVQFTAVQGAIGVTKLRVYY